MTHSAGSGNYWEAIKGSTNEIQAGGGVLFCMQYAASHDIDDMKGKFNHALKMQIQIVSTAGWDEGRVVGDAGFKAMFPTGNRLPGVVSHDGLLQVESLCEKQ